MAKKKIEIFIEVHTQREFDYILKTHSEQLICAEVFSYVFGFSTALDRLFNKIKLDWSDGKIILLKVPADEIESLKRFRNQSEPVYLFILNMKVSKVFRGVDMIRFGELTKRELQYHHDFESGMALERELYALDEPTPDEIQWIETRTLEKKQEALSAIYRREARQAARKRHRAELMVPHLSDLNFVFYWPHCLHAHPELYERWDANNIIMIARETIEVTDELVNDIFYAGDAPINEASLQKLRSGPGLALCLRLLSTDQCFTSLVRRIMYEDIKIPPHDDSEQKKLLPMITAFDYYKSYSLTKDEILKRRALERERQKADIKEKRARRLSVMQTLAREAIEDAIKAKRAAREQHKLNLLKAGNLAALEKLKEEQEDDEVSIVVPEELEDEEETVLSEEDPDEHFPPPGLLIPGFYVPPNDIAKANGLAVLFPKLVHERVIPQPEFLPPHILIMLEIHKRYKAIEAITPYKSAIIHMGIFKASSPYNSTHIAYTVKQFDTIDNTSMNLDELKIAFMISTESDIPTLQLVELNPCHVSRDDVFGEEECAIMFAVDYGDHYDQFEDF